MATEVTTPNNMSRSVPVGTVSDRVQKIKTIRSTSTSNSNPEVSTQNGYIGKAQTFTPTHRKKAVEMNGFISHGRVSGGKYVVTGSPSGLANYGFSESMDNLKGISSGKKGTNRQLSFTEDLLDSSDQIQMLNKVYQNGGEEISGTVIMDLSKSLEIRYLELVVVGVGNASLTKTGKLFTQQENYMYKRTCVIGNNETKWTSLLTPGKYVSNFHFHLSKDVPSSMDYDEQYSGLRFNVSYFIKARLIDSSRKSVASKKHKKAHQKSLLSYRLDFKVLRPFDVNMLPDVNLPINHMEEVALACGKGRTATIGLALDRSVFLAGDDIRLQISLAVPASRKIKEIICGLQQHVSFQTPGQRASYTLVQLQNKNPEETAVVTIESNMKTSSYEVVIPTHNDILTSFNYGCNILKVTYSVKTLIKFSQGGGKLNLAMPIAIGPCAEPIYYEKSAFKKAVPVFKRPVRFPCFTPASRNSSFYSQEQSSQSSRKINVVTKYQVSPFGRIFLCCFGRGK
ncbi:hypothetical protein LOTGIDRAFT_175442 [Lottia gigantea]|uniref:Arrestin C-terminal-like domain-containing protein n=1 Tax=Lottia gigantea TaxID=225164 RepID=V3ZSJ4_LOTGI|nr:hypothetical protein LOTGIDRAFT_175442 [Lottia gigantea]ESO94408.1 hypothetical protein LOTGIDRAFT_175442 [Lottia gigantea]